MTKVGCRRELRILQIVNPVIPVPPTHHGGVERIADGLIAGLLKRGHRVTLAAHPDSGAPAEKWPLASALPPSRPRPCRDLLRLSALLRAEPFDIVHNHGRLLYLLPLSARNIPRVQTFHLVINPRTQARLKQLRMLCGKKLCCVSVSDQQRHELDHDGAWETVYNGIALDRYHFQASVDDRAPLVFLGRVEPDKGTDIAIQVAKASRRRLMIAGPYHGDPGDWRDYWEQIILPQVDGRQVIYLGPVDDQQKNSLLGNCSALLMPVQWEEPFGLVMAEALACGTPVIGFGRGAIPEVISHGETGFVCRTVGDMVDAVGAISTLSREACRKRCERLFSEEVMVKAYESLYFRLAGA